MRRHFMVITGEMRETSGSFWLRFVTIVIIQMKGSGGH